MAGLAPTGMMAVVVQGVTGVAGGVEVVATQTLQETWLMLPWHVPCARVPITPAPEGQVQIPAPLVLQVAIEEIVVTGVDEPPEQ